MGMTTRADQYEPLPADKAARWAKFAKWDTVYFPQFLGFHVEEAKLDYCRMRVPFRPEFNQPAGVMHGGVIMALIDTVVVPAIGSAYDEPREIFTIDISVRFIAPIVNEDAIAEGWVVKRGRSIVFLDAEVRTGSGTIAATGSLVYKVSSKPQIKLD
jgi:uncharacterized protein (TIGR00369 family)